MRFIKLIDLINLILISSGPSEWCTPSCTELAKRDSPRYSVSRSSRRGLSSTVSSSSSQPSKLSTRESSGELSFFIDKVEEFNFQFGRAPRLPGDSAGEEEIFPSHLIIKQHSQSPGPATGFQVSQSVVRPRAKYSYENVRAGQMDFFFFHSKYIAPLPVFYVLGKMRMSWT